MIHRQTKSIDLNHAFLFLRFDNWQHIDIPCKELTSGYPASSGSLACADYAISGVDGSSYLSRPYDKPGILEGMRPALVLGSSPGS